MLTRGDAERRKGWDIPGLRLLEQPFATVPTRQQVYHIHRMRLQSWKNAHRFSSAFIEGANRRVKLFNGWSHLRGLIFRCVTLFAAINRPLMYGYFRAACAVKITFSMVNRRPIEVVNYLVTLAGWFLVPSRLSK
jgi:hypothetical protein